MTFLFKCLFFGLFFFGLLQTANSLKLKNASNQDSVVAPVGAEPGSLNSNCKNVMDLVVILDASSSVKRNRWMKLKNFTSSLPRAFNMGEETVRISVITYSSGATIHWNLDSEEARDGALFAEAVQRLPYRGGLTDTNVAFKKARKVLFREPGSRPEASKVILLATDGKSTHHIEAKIEAQKLIRKGAIVAVAAIRGANVSQCMEYTTCKWNNSYTCPFVRTFDWDRLVGNMKQLIKQICATLPVDAVCSDWSHWEPECQTCGASIKQTRKREELQPPTKTETGQVGVSCTLHEEQLCPVTKACDDRVCGGWMMWQDCSTTCGPGKRMRERINVDVCEKTVPLESDYRIVEDCFVKKCDENQTVTGDIEARIYQTVTGDMEARTDSPGTGDMEAKTDSPGTGDMEAKTDSPGTGDIKERLCGEWMQWQDCSTTCGPGTRKREPINADICVANHLKPEYEIGDCLIKECDKEPAESSNTAAIAGGVVGGVALAAIAGGGAYYATSASAPAAAANGNTFESTQDQETGAVENDEAISLDADSDFWTHNNDI